MIVSCPECEKRYKLPDDKIKDAGVKVKCKNCETVFKVTADGVAVEGAPAPLSEEGEVRYELHGPGGESLGPFPLETVVARIEVGEVSRDWEIRREGDDERVPIADLPELAGVEWPAAAADEPPAGGGDDDFGFDDFDLGGDESTGGEPEFGFDDEGPDLGAGGGEEDFGFDDLGGDEPAGGDDDGLGLDDDFDLGGDEAPAGGDAEDDLDFDDFDLGGGDAGGGEDLGLDDDLDLGGDAGADAGEDDLGIGDDFDLGGDDEPAGGDDLDFGDDFDLGGEASAGGGEPDAGIGEDFDFGDFTDEGGAAEEQADWGDAAPGGGDDALSALFDEEEAEEEPPTPTPSDQDLGDAFAASDQEEMSEDAFAFGDDGDADVFYDEDFDEDFEEEVVRQVEGDPDEGDAEVSEGAEEEDEELITTLEQLSQARPQKRFPTAIVAGGLVGLLAVVGALMYFLPGTVRQVPGVGGLTLSLHEKLNSDYHKASVLSEKWAEARDRIGNWTPVEVLAGLPRLREILGSDPTYEGALRLGGQAVFFLEALTQEDAPAFPVEGPGGVGGLYLWAAGRIDEAPSVATDTADWALASGWRQYREEEIEAALVTITGATPVSMPVALLQPLAAARIYEDLGRGRPRLAALQQAIEAQPDNPWVLLLYAQAVWEIEERASEVLSALKDAESGIERLGQGSKLAYYELGARAALKKDQLGLARRYTKDGLGLAPKSAPLLTLKGKRLMRESEWADAYGVLDQAVAADPDYVEGLVAKAHALAGIGRTGDATALLRESWEKQSDSLPLARAYIEHLMSQNRFEPAEEVFSKAIKMAPEDPTVIQLGADLALAQNKVELAEKRLARLREAGGAGSVVSLKLAEIALNRGDLAMAERRLRELAKAQPENLQVRLQLGKLLLKQDRPKQAEETLLDARAQAPGHAPTYALLARAYLDQGRPANAREMVAEAMKINNSIWSLYQLQGEAYLQQGDVTEAIYSFEKAVEMSGGSVEPELWFARANEEAGRPGKAVEIYQRVLDRDPTNLDALEKLSRLHYATDDYRKALPLLERWRKADPQAADAYLLAGRIHNLRNDHEQALEILRQGVRRLPQEADLYSEAAWSYLKEQNIERARANLTRANRMEPNDALTQMRLGYLYKNLGQESRAKRAFQKAIDLGLEEEQELKAQSELQSLAY